MIECTFQMISNQDVQSVCDREGAKDLRIQNEDEFGTHKFTCSYYTIQ